MLLTGILQPRRPLPQHNQRLKQLPSLPAAVLAAKVEAAPGAARVKVVETRPTPADRYRSDVAPALPMKSLT